LRFNVRKDQETFLQALKSCIYGFTTELNASTVIQRKNIQLSEASFVLVMIRSLMMAPNGQLTHWYSHHDPRSLFTREQSQILLASCERKPDFKKIGEPEQQSLAGFDEDIEDSFNEESDDDSSDDIMRIIDAANLANQYHWWSNAAYECSDKFLSNIVIGKNLQSEELSSVVFNTLMIEYYGGDSFTNVKLLDKQVSMYRKVLSVVGQYNPHAHDTTVTMKVEELSDHVIDRIKRVIQARDNDREGILFDLLQGEVLTNTLYDLVHQQKSCNETNSRLLAANFDDLFLEPDRDRGMKLINLCKAFLQIYLLQ
jgi:hypothetical protein